MEDMSAWARRRYTLYTLIVVVIVAILGVSAYAAFFYSPANCFDGEQNNGEQGVDCGGSCSLICPFQAADPQVIWAQAFEISDGVYNAAGLIENPNFTARLTGQYKLSLFNQDVIRTKEIFGPLDIGPSESQPIFEPSILTGEQEISRAFLEVVDGFEWNRDEPVDNPLVISARTLTDTETRPRLRTTIENTSLEAVRDIAVYALLYNREGDIVQASRTFVEYIDRDGNAEAFFTWPLPFEEEVTKIDVFTEPVEF